MNNDYFEHDLITFFLFRNQVLFKILQQKFLEEIKFDFNFVGIRPAHFSHFSREREMVLRDISREKWAARNCEKNRQILSELLASFGPNLTNI